MLGIHADALGILATLYGFGAAGAALLQARQILRRGSSCDVSARFFATYAGGYAIWLLYGLAIGSVPLILVDVAGLVCGVITLAITLRMRGSLLRPRSWAACAERGAKAVEEGYGGRAPSFA
jgi:MtN3 and saliva related transmembrane protein